MAGYAVNIDDGMNGRNGSIKTTITVDGLLMIKHKLIPQNLTRIMRKVGPLKYDAGVRNT
jgi:hypothetical protein